MEPLSPTRYLGQKIVSAFGLVRAGEEPRPNRVGCSFGDHGLEVRMPARSDTLVIRFIVGWDDRLAGWAYLHTGGLIAPAAPLPVAAWEPLVKLNNLMDGYLPYALYADYQKLRRDDLIGWLTAPARSSDSPELATDPSH